MNMDSKNKTAPENEDNCCDHEENNTEDNCCYNENEKIENEDNCCSQGPEKTIKAQDDCCSHDHENSNDEHQGCACEQGILENIDSIEEKKSKKPLIILGIGIFIFVIGYFISTMSFNLFDLSTISDLSININQDIISQIIYLIVVLIVGPRIIKHGITSLLNKEVKIELLITIATFGAFFLGDGGEGATRARHALGLSAVLHAAPARSEDARLGPHQH